MSHVIRLVVGVIKVRVLTRHFKLYIAHTYGYYVGDILKRKSLD